MRRFVLILVLYLLIYNGFGFDLGRPIGGASTAMGRTSVCGRGIWTLQNNPAGLAYTDRWSFGVYYENAWMLRETAYKFGGIAKGIPRIGCIGVSFLQFGGSVYSENKLGLAYARAFGPYLQLGIQADYLLLHWGEGYNNQNAFSIEVGLQSQITSKLRLGAYVFNPIHSRLGTLHDESLPIMMRLGMAYQFTEEFLGQCEVEYDTDRAGLSIRTGFEYLVFKKFHLRAGIQANPNIFSFGISYQVAGIVIEVSAQMQQMLGVGLGMGVKRE